MSYRRTWTSPDWHGSYRRAAELFELATRPLTHPAATGGELADLRG